LDLCSWVCVEAAAMTRMTKTIMTTVVIKLMIDIDDDDDDDDDLVAVIVTS
jgi:hypothetical protein